MSAIDALQCLQIQMLQPNIFTASDARQVVVQTAYPLLIIKNGPISEELAKIISSSHAFLLAKTDKNILSHPDVVEVANFTHQGQKYSILRKVPFNLNLLVYAG